MILDQLTNRELDVLHRIAAGSSDEEIAEELFLSINTIKWHNRNIYSKLGVESRTKALVIAHQLGLLDQESPIEDQIPSYGKSHLPAQVSSFIGREPQIQEIRELLETKRLITLTGPGGVGKTRLAIEAVNDHEDNHKFKDGLFFIELASVSKPERVGDALLSALGIVSLAGQASEDLLVNFLEEKRILLVIDNFEHLLDAAPMLQGLLMSAPDLTILCTSRESLNLSGEQVYTVHPLSVPDNERRATSIPLSEYESLALFIDRVNGVRSGFEPTEIELSLVADICRRLDGLPLAIELAAGRADFFSLEDLHKQMDNRFAILKDGPRDFSERHDNLERAIDWSYNLLSNEEQTLFYRLAAFQGSRTIEAVESVCCFDLTLDVLNGLDSLCSKNLVQQEIGLDGESRFYLLETIHEYLIHRLRNSGEAEQIFQRHAKYFIELAENGKYPTRGGPEQITWLKRLEADHDNLRASRDWAISSGNMAEALRLVGSLDFFWLRMGSFDEGLNWVKASLEFIDEAPASVRASVYGAAGEILSFVDEDHDKSIEYYERAIDIYQKLGNKREIGWTSARVIYSYMMVSDIDAVQKYGKKSIKLLSEVGDNIGIAHALTIVGLHEYLSNQLIGAKTIFEEALSIARENHDRLRESISLLNLASVKFKEGDAKCANRLFKESLKVQIDIGHSRHSGTGLLSYLAGTAVALNQPRRAVKLLGAEENQYIRRGYNPQPHQSKMFQDYLSEAQLQLGSKAFEQAWSEGKAMSYDQAIAFALEISKIESFDVDPVTDPNIISGKDF